MSTDTKTLEWTIRVATISLLGSRENARTPRPQEAVMKGSEKPKKLAKKAPQKTLKEKRSEKKAKGQNR